MLLPKQNYKSLWGDRIQKYKAGLAASKEKFPIPNSQFPIFVAKYTQNLKKNLITTRLPKFNL